MSLIRRQDFLNIPKASLTYLFKVDLQTDTSGHRTKSKKALTGRTTEMEFIWFQWRNSFFWAAWQYFLFLSLTYKFISLDGWGVILLLFLFQKLIYNNNKKTTGRCQNLVTLHRWPGTWKHERLCRVSPSESWAWHTVSWFPPAGFLGETLLCVCTINTELVVLLCHVCLSHTCSPNTCFAMCLSLSVLQLDEVDIFNIVPKWEILV